jgi:hypothetical protein
MSLKVKWGNIIINMNNKVIEEAYLESRENYFEFFECSIPDSRVLDVEELLHLFAVPDKEYDQVGFRYRVFDRAIFR